MRLAYIANLVEQRMQRMGAFGHHAAGNIYLVNSLRLVWRQHSWPKDHQVVRSGKGCTRDANDLRHIGLTPATICERLAGPIIISNQVGRLEPVPNCAVEIKRFDMRLGYPHNPHTDL